MRLRVSKAITVDIDETTDRGLIDLLLTGDEKATNEVLFYYEGHHRTCWSFTSERLLAENEKPRGNYYSVTREDTGRWSTQEASTPPDQNTLDVVKLINQGKRDELLNLGYSEEQVDKWMGMVQA